MDPITVNCTIIDWCEVTAILFDTFMGACFTVLLGGLVALGVNWYRRWKYRRQEEILLGLAKLRTAGVDIRNLRPPAELEGDDLLTWLAVWTANVQAWLDALYDQATYFSPVEAERLKTLDQMVLKKYDGVTNESQLHTLRYLSETLKRLDKMLELRFRPTQSP